MLIFIYVCIIVLIFIHLQVRWKSESTIILAFSVFICMWICMYVYIHACFKPREKLRLSVSEFCLYVASIHSLLQLYAAIN